MGRNYATPWTKPINIDMSKDKIITSFFLIAQD